MAEDTQAKWEGKASVEVAGLTAEQVWPCLEDFCNLHKWHPYLDTCYLVEGVPGQPGMVRYCATADKRWAKEKLIMINPIQRILSYEVIDNNIGMKSYVSTVKIFPIHGEGKNGCMIDWSYVSEPFEGWKHEDFVSYLNSSLQSMAKKMESDLLQIV